MDTGFFNSMSDGDFGNGFILCQSLTEGDFWTRRQGCYCVYRGCNRLDNIDHEHIVGSCSETGLLNLPDYLTHEANTDYYYALRRASSTGKQEYGTVSIVCLSLDTNAERHAERPNMVLDLQARPTHDGKIDLSWWYWPISQAAEPVSFAIFSDNGSGTIDYTNPLSIISYTGRHCYVATVSAGDTATQRFSVRSVATGGTHDGNCAFVTATADSVGPDSQLDVSGAVSL